MKDKKAFTLIELLVVISIIALLLSVLVPSLGKAKKAAKAVVCKSNLHQWGIAALAYVQDNKDRMEVGASAGLWQLQLRPYIGLSKETGKAKGDFNFCPEATKTRLNIDETPGKGFGLGPRSAWGRYGNSSYMEGIAGSYGMNWWVYNTSRTEDEGHTLSKEWGRFDVSGGSRIPLIFDCYLFGTYPEAYDDPPPDETDSSFQDFRGMGEVCVNRHGGYINTVFLDASIGKVGLKELWTLSWNREFRKEWHERSGYRDPPIDWPDWMDSFKDY